MILPTKRKIVLFLALLLAFALFSVGCSNSAGNQGNTEHTTQSPASSQATAPTTASTAPARDFSALDDYIAYMNEYLSKIDSDITSSMDHTEDCLTYSISDSYFDDCFDYYDSYDAEFELSIVKLAESWVTGTCYTSAKSKLEELGFGDLSVKVALFGSDMNKEPYVQSMDGTITINRFVGDQYPKIVSVVNHLENEVTVGGKTFIMTPGYTKSTFFTDFSGQDIEAIYQRAKAAGDVGELRKCKAEWDALIRELLFDNTELAVVREKLEYYGLPKMKLVARIVPMQTDEAKGEGKDEDKNDQILSYVTVSEGEITYDIVNDIEWHEEGMYKVGVDIPAGEYCLKQTGSYKAYMSVCSDSNGDDILTNENFDGVYYVTLEDGQYFNLSRAKFASASHVLWSYDESNLETSMYRVGIDIPAGEYSLKAMDDSLAYVCVYDNSSASQDIIMNDNFRTNRYVTVSDGQYLILKRCTGSLVN